MCYSDGVACGTERYTVALTGRQRSRISKLGAEAADAPRIGGNKRRCVVRYGNGVARWGKSYTVCIISRQRSWIGELGAEARTAPRVGGDAG